MPRFPENERKRGIQLFRRGGSGTRGCLSGGRSRRRTALFRCAGRRRVESRLLRFFIASGEYDGSHQQSGDANTRIFERLLHRLFPFLRQSEAFFRFPQCLSCGDQAQRRVSFPPVGIPSLRVLYTFCRDTMLQRFPPGATAPAGASRFFASAGGFCVASSFLHPAEASDRQTTLSSTRTRNNRRE